MAAVAPVAPVWPVAPVAPVALPEDRAAAQRWFRAAAQLGHGQAQLMLGRYLAEGVDGEPDAAEARS